MFRLDTALQWYIGLFQFDGSAAVVMPVTIKRLSMLPLIDVVEFGEAKTTTMVITSWANILVRPVAWHSFSWLCRRWPAGMTTVQPAVHLYADAREISMAQFAAEAGWWDLSTSQLKKVADSLGMPTTAGCSEVDLLYDMTASALKTEDHEKVLYAMQTRFATLQPFDDDDLSTLMELDEAIDVLDKSDEAEVHESKKQVASKARKFKEYTADYRTRASTARASAGGDSKGFNSMH